MLTVFCVLWGDKYHKGYVYALKEMVRKNLSYEHRFVCITTEKLEGIETRLPWVSWRGWWQKLQLFSPYVTRGPSLFFDLDVVITGNLDYLMPFTKNKFSAPSNWAKSGHGGIQSSVMAWDGTWHAPFDKFNYVDDSKRLWGDQEFIWELLGDDWFRIPYIRSYKYHCSNGLPELMRVCVFHGSPKPHEVSDKWILPYTQTLRSRIKEDTQATLPKGLEGMGCMLK